MGVDMNQSLVGVDSLFQINRKVADHCKRGITVEVLEKSHGLLLRQPTLQCGDSKYSSREISAHRHEVDTWATGGLKSGESHAYLREMLVSEWFVDGYIVRTPRKMGGGRRFHTRTGRAGKCGYVDVAVRGRRPAAASGASDSCMAVAKHPGFATFPASLMRAAFTSGNPYT